MVEYSKEWHRDRIAQLESEKKDLGESYKILLSFLLILISTGFMFLVFYTGKGNFDKIILYSIIIFLTSIITIIFVLILFVSKSIYNNMIKRNYKVLLR